MAGDNHYLSQLFQKVHYEALVNNSRTISKWTDFKKENEGVQERLKLFLKDLRVPVMIPIGNKAFFRGQMVHTNDILISLGDGYFVKGSVEQATLVSQRRLKKCDDMLKALEKEKELLENRLSGSMNPDVFSSGGLTDINEPYDEKEDEKWRKERSTKVKAQNEAVKAEQSQIKDDELFKRLEYLEMQEELEDELIRLGIDENDLDDYSVSGEESDTESSSSETNVEVPPPPPVEDNTPVRPKKNPKNSRVTFAEPILSEAPLEQNVKVSPIQEEITDPAVSENVVESDSKKFSAQTESRPVSRFKASRQKK